MENKHLAKAIIYGTILLIISNVTGYGMLGNIFAVVVTITSLWLAFNVLNSYQV